MFYLRSGLICFQILSKETLNLPLRDCNPQYAITLFISQINFSDKTLDTERYAHPLNTFI